MLRLQQEPLTGSFQLEYIAFLEMINYRQRILMFQISQRF